MGKIQSGNGKIPLYMVFCTSGRYSCQKMTESLKKAFGHLKIQKKVCIYPAEAPEHMVLQPAAF